MLVTSNQWGVVETSEARYAEISREMLRSGDWVHPKLLSIYHYHKPPFTYWLTAVSYAIFGVNAFAARFFLTIAFCSQVFLIFKLAQHLFKCKKIAYNTALVYATLPIVLISVRGLTTDAYLNTFILLILYWWIKFLESRKIHFMYGIAATMGLGFLTKGPVVFIVPVFAMVGLLRWYPRPYMSLAQTALSFVIFACIGFSWFVLLIGEDFRFADYFFLHHFVDRFAHAEMFVRKEPWYFYLPLIPMVSLPWIIFFFAAFFYKKANENGQKLSMRLAVWFVLLPLIIFSISSSKLVLYILPLFIGFSLVTGYFLASEIPKQLLFAFFGLLVLVYVALVLVPFYSPKFTVDNRLVVLTVVTIILSLGTWFLRLSRERTILMLSTLFAVHLILFASQFFALNSIEVNSVASISSFIKQNNLRERNILVHDELLPSLAFELDKDIISLYAGDRSLQRETQFEKNDQWKNFLIATTDQGGPIKLKSLLSEKSVVIVKRELPLILGSAMSGEWHKKTFGKWAVYYNNDD
jgi:4-amino-4-deoxy-L-arabinose transferase